MNRHDFHQPHAIVRTGRPHIDNEIEILLAVADILPEGAVFIDAGANIGLIAVPLACRIQARGGRVIAFEPQRLTYYMLAGNIVLAGLTNIFCHQIALGAQPGTVLVPERNPGEPQDFGAVSLLAEEVHGITVPVVPIDHLGLDRFDLLKLDVEGMELSVLSGAEEAIMKFRPLIWVEIWPVNYEPVCSWLANRNYELFVFDALNFLAVPFERESKLPFTLEKFDGLQNPHFVDAFGTHTGVG